MRPVDAAVFCCAVAGASASLCLAQPATSLRSPNAALLARRGPDSASVRFFTTKGAFTVRLHRDWAPRGSDRLFHLVRARYYDGVTFFRVIEGYMAQAGFHGDPAVTAAWDQFPLKDDPVRQSNKRGAVTFATAGPNSRTTQFFVNLEHNANLDALGFAPVGAVVDGMAVVDSLYSGYGENSPRGDGPLQRRIAAEGNKYLRKEFPKFDVIDSARVIESWQSAATGRRGGTP